MATRFELVLYGDDPVGLRAAGEEALREIRRIGRRFSFYDPSSELSRINHHAFDSEVSVAGDLFELLQICDSLWRLTGGAFDPTMGPLMEVWNFGKDQPRIPSPEKILEVLGQTGWQNVKLDSKTTSVRFLKSGIRIDLGGIAKGWALDEATDLLKEAGVQSGLLHGGTSSVVGIGNPPQEKAWTVGIADPYELSENPSWFETASLRDSALSVSAVHGKSMTIGSVEYGHVIDPKTGLALSGPIVGVVESMRAAPADAMSTALLAGFSASRDLPLGFTRAERFQKMESGWKLTSSA